MTKICTKCLIEKDVTEFYKRKYKSGKIGLKESCILCHNYDSK